MATSIRISEAASLAMHAMACLVSNEGGPPLHVAGIARALGASEAHLGKVLQRLARLGYAESRRGPRGGYTLGERGGDVTLLEIYEAVDGPLGQATCLLGRPACGGGRCILGGLLESVNRQVREHLGATRISDLVLGIEDARRAS
jgi:Rrf2 family protein